MLHKNWADGRIGWYRLGVHRCAQVGTSLRECALVYAGVCGSAWVSTSVCVMNSQNNWRWRIESLHQRTLIRILHEFFSINFSVTQSREKEY